MRTFFAPFKFYRLHNIFNVKQNSSKIIKAWKNQTEQIITQRIFRRTEQICYHYYKIWEERALREFLLKLKHSLLQNRKGFLLSSVGIYSFNWNRERINYEGIKEYFTEFDKIQSLKEKTIFCNECHKRKYISSKVAGIEYCAGHEENCKPKDVKLGEWQPYLERKNMITWKKEIVDGHFAYKVLVKYPDITAEDFLFVQTDLDYRKQWDDSAIQLELIESDPSKGSNSQIIYWEVLWPKLFANRDYVYNRRYFIDRSRKIIVIANKSTKHPNCPLNPKNQRVHEYWSYMVIRPTKTFKQPGLEFILTYYDNPGIKIPKTVTNWVAQRQMPDFLDKLHQATVAYAGNKTGNVVVPVDIWTRIRDPGFEYPAEFGLNIFDVEEDEQFDEDMADNVNHTEQINNNDDKKPILDIDEMEDVEPTRRYYSFWSYLNPISYFY